MNYERIIWCRSWIVKLTARLKASSEFVIILLSVNTRLLFNLLPLIQIFAHPNVCFVKWSHMILSAQYQYKNDLSIVL